MGNFLKSISRYDARTWWPAVSGRLCCAIMLGVFLLGAGSPALAASPPVSPTVKGDLIANAAATATGSNSWFADAQHELVRREYDVSDNGVGFQAPNRAQGFRIYFESDGVRLVERSQAAEPMASLRMDSIGRSGSTKAITATQVHIEGNQASLETPALHTRFDNTDSGLGLHWTVPLRPTGTGPITLELDIADATPQQGNNEIFLQGTKSSLRLGDIQAVDGNGVKFAVTLKAEGDRLQLSIDDANAIYPLQLQATMSNPSFNAGDSPESVIDGQADAQLEANQGGAWLGWSVAGAGDVNGDGYADVIVGALFYDNGDMQEGAAFMYLGGPGAFNTVADALLDSNQAMAHMGGSVAGAGDVNGDGFADLIVGVSDFDSGETDEGAAFVYFGGAGAFNTSVDAVLQSNQVGAALGYSVSGAGDVNGDGYADVVVGAYRYSAGQTEEGAAFIYFGGSGAFNTAADAQLESNQAGAFLGASVAGAGDVNGDGYADVIVGASIFDSLQVDEGGAFVYFGGAGAFNQSADGQLVSGQGGARMGASVAGAGDVNGDGYADVIVGVPLYGGEGAAFLYFGGAGGFNTTRDALLTVNGSGAQMGSSVAGAGDVNGDGYADVIVGAPFYCNTATEGGCGPLPREGAAFVYFGGRGAFDTARDGSLLGSQADGRMGNSVAGAGDVNGDGFADLIVGAPYFDNAQTDEGAAFVYFGGVGALLQADGTLEANQAGAKMGASVAEAGDVNGDGFSDVIVGAPYYDNGQTDEGAAFVYFGGPISLDTTFDARLENNQPNEQMGWSVAGAGDVNGDGYADVIVGAPMSDFLAFNSDDYGAAFIYLGGPGAFDTTRDKWLFGNQSGSRRGNSVSGAGDVNGDGFSDVIVGANLYSSGESNEGVAFVYFGSASLFGSPSPAVLQSNQANAQLGFSVASAGDVNGDGYADVLVGAPYYDNGSADEGAAFVYLGGPGIFDTTNDGLMESNQQSAQMGFSVASAGDVNGDGFSDVIVGARYYDLPLFNAGAAMIYLGGPGIFSTTWDALLSADQASAQAGYSVAGAGDINGDGYADVVVGAPFFERPGNPVNEGGIFIYLGGDGPFDSSSDSQFHGGQINANLGWSVAGAGDVNGDGFADLILGLPNYDSGQVDEGVASILLGNGKGRVVSVEQHRGDASLPVQPWGLSHRVDGFVAVQWATSPRGRESVRLQLEACPSGVAFGAPTCTRFTRAYWTELVANSSGGLLPLSATGLDANSVYHWRSRVQYAPLTINLAGITAPPNPASGPWRRLQANGDVADIRTSSLSDVIFANGFD